MDKDFVTDSLIDRRYALLLSDIPQSQATSGGESDVVMNTVNGDVVDSAENKEEEDMEEGTSLTAWPKPIKDSQI